ncbi:hypothetical protein [Pseudoroseomonas ludipueritiae]|uniref:Uncharacterized protein n=1 Tax=Pseudoroseomonas ludipueritiae TaxID=198093 RepID=A0ABR7R6H6_9PROT|nr:hypothetical protein [Pseudoroseomonas ludipueritiae]MBC9177384.1 hypothetical protein [Pseudoroseomonas ludipueritiae]
MKKILMLGAGLALMGATSVAMAQAPQPPAAAPQTTEAAPPPPPGGPGMHRHGMRGPGGPGMMHGPGPHRFGPPPPPSKAASFNFQNGDMRIRIRCAEDEPMQNCVNAASALIDKVGGMTSAPATTPAR